MLFFVFDLQVPDDDDENLQYEQLRREATNHYLKRKEYFQKAQDAYRRGQRPVASYYAQVVSYGQLFRPFRLFFTTENGFFLFEHFVFHTVNFLYV